MNKLDAEKRISDIIYRIVLLVVFLLGITTPFTIIFIFETFILTIPILLYLGYFSSVFLFSLVMRRKEIGRMCLKFLLPVLIYVGSQFLASYTVENYQKLRCRKLITQLEEYKSIHYQYPDSLEKTIGCIGIDYSLSKDGSYTLRFDVGFSVKEVYYGNEKEWRRHGWNN